jgi:alpha-mannosidase
MAPFDECCVLIPSATLEDFPTNAADFDARSILAAWTVLWHPHLLAQTEQLPTWYRADSPPDADGPRVVVVPTLSVDQLPRGYEAKCQKQGDCRWITGETREEMLAALDLPELPTLRTDHRELDSGDFFAAGFAALQIQVMTRRLRYTSNLDEIHLQNRIVAAAKAFVAGDASGCADALHDVFDCLAEERDHYFSSDPHLIDLTLLTPATLDKFVQQPLSGALTSAEDEECPILATPGNVLIDHAVATALAGAPTDQYETFRDALAGGQLGWAGGDPDPTLCLDALSFDQADAAMGAGHRLATAAIGTPPPVYARLTGATPSDLTAAIVDLGYAGMIPIDFSHGTGFGDEAKVIRQAGGVEIQALTAKPIDAASDASFLNLGARLGEAIDSGEIATALLAHWPGAACQSFEDLKRAASWSLVLGRFWKLDDYFRDGEHPYHHGSARAVSADAATVLTEQIQRQVKNPLTSGAASFRDAARSQAAARLRAMVALIAGDSAGKGDGKDVGADDEEDLVGLASAFARSSGCQVKSGTANSMLCVNPYGSGSRTTVGVDGYPPAKADHIYAASREGSQTVVSLDIPAYGFALATAASEDRGQRSLFGRLFSSPTKIAEGTTLHNEFMEVSISPKSGGIQGVYSGATRGNRFSMRLVQVTSRPGVDDGEKNDSQMVADKVHVVTATESLGEIAASGKLIDANSKTVATFQLCYRLHRGSRLIEVTGALTPVAEITGEPWRNYLGARVAVASEGAIVRVLVRDKIHRGRSRRLVSPLGLVVDEAERQTLISAGGLAFHRRVGDRFVDTLLAVQGETDTSLKLDYGFNVPNAVSTAQSLLAGPAAVPVQTPDSLPPRGWILYVSPADVIISNIDVRRREDGYLAAAMRVIQTRSRSANVTIRFCRDVQFASILEGGDADRFNRPIETPESDEQANPAKAITHEGDAVRFSTASHQVADILVVFAK